MWAPAEPPVRRLHPASWIPLNPGCPGQQRDATLCDTRRDETAALRHLALRPRGQTFTLVGFLLGGDLRVRPAPLPHAGPSWDRPD